MQASRLLSILLQLQTRGRLTARALADAFEVSVRTIYRDVDQLSAAGVPIYAEKGPNGGFQLIDGYRTRLTGLTPQEAETIFLAGLPGPAAELGLGEAMAQARMKLLAALPDKSRGDAERIAARFHLDPVGWFQGAEENALLPTLALAVWTNRIVRMRYDSWKGVVEREAAPLGLVLKAGLWYVVAGVGDQARTYRVAYILSLETTDKTFTPPAGFDLARHWARFSRDYEQRMQQGRARVRATPDGLRALARLNHATALAVRVAGAPNREGWREIEIPIESIELAAGDLIRLGDEVEALAPPALRAAVVATIGKLQRRYGASRNISTKSGPAKVAGRAALTKSKS
jgi:predicted DNA-binding transcriptional regulator YafY